MHYDNALYNIKHMHKILLKFHENQAFFSDFQPFFDFRLVSSNMPPAHSGSQLGGVRGEAPPQTKISPPPPQTQFYPQTQFGPLLVIFTLHTTIFLSLILLKTGYHYNNNLCRMVKFQTLARHRSTCDKLLSFRMSIIIHKRRCFKAAKLRFVIEIEKNTKVC